MLGKNHAVYGAAAWIGAYPFLAGEWPGVEEPGDPVLLAASTCIAAGAAVIADLDHPDAKASRQFGFLSRFVAKGINSASGGHRRGTHSITCAVLLGAVAALAHYAPPIGTVEWGRWTAAIMCGFCATTGLALIGPSIGFKVPAIADFLLGGLIGWWVFGNMPSIGPLLWVIASGGIIVHCLCDAVTKGGVPFLMPFSRKRFALNWFRVGGSGEKVASALGVLACLAATVATASWIAEYH